MRVRDTPKVQTLLCREDWSGMRDHFQRARLVHVPKGRRVGKRERIGKKRNRLTKNNNETERKGEGRGGGWRQTGCVVGGGWREPS